MVPVERVREEEMNEGADHSDPKVSPPEMASQSQPVAREEACPWFGLNGGMACTPAAERRETAAHRMNRRMGGRRSSKPRQGRQKGGAVALSNASSSVGAFPPPQRPRKRSSAPFIGCVIVLLAFVFTVFLVGCKTPQPLAEGTRVGIYARAGRVFNQSVLLKPAETNTPLFKLAPLILKEARNAGSLELRPTIVYAWTNVAKLGGKTVPQLCYVWRLDHGDGSMAPPQGIKITLDESGQPMLWEVLRDDSGARVVFASQTLEARAMTAFSAPAPGRRYWIERSVEEAPDVVVARVLDDPPVVMGPIVYTDSDASEVVTVICRCMEAQARALAGQGEYQLRELNPDAVRQRFQPHRRMLKSWLANSTPENLNKLLRLPD